MATSKQEHGHHAWLAAQIRATYEDGEALLEASKAARSQKYPWLLARLKERGNTALVEEYRIRRNADERARSYVLKRARLVQLEKLLAQSGEVPNELGTSYTNHLEKTAARLRLAIERYEQEGAHGQV